MFPLKRTALDVAFSFVSKIPIGINYYELFQIELVFQVEKFCSKAFFKENNCKLKRDRFCRLIIFYGLIPMNVHSSKSAYLWSAFGHQLLAGTHIGRLETRTHSHTFLINLLFGLKQIILNGVGINFPNASDNRYRAIEKRKYDGKWLII